MDWYYWGMHGMGFAWLFPLLFLGILVLMLVRRPRRHGGDGSIGRPRETARDILDRRYASGEIPKEQYDQMKKDIGEK